MMDETGRFNRAESLMPLRSVRSAGGTPAETKPLLLPLPPGVLGVMPGGLGNGELAFRDGGPCPGYPPPPPVVLGAGSAMGRAGGGGEGGGDFGLPHYQYHHMHHQAELYGHVNGGSMPKVELPAAYDRPLAPSHTATSPYFAPSPFNCASSSTPAATGSYAMDVYANGRDVHSRDVYLSGGAASPPPPPPPPPQSSSYSLPTLPPPSPPRPTSSSSSSPSPSVLPLQTPPSLPLHSSSLAVPLHRTLPAKTSTFRGVRWDAGRLKWRADIGLEQGKRRFLGCYGDELEAAHAYDRAAKELKASPVLNFMEDGSLNPGRKSKRAPSAAPRTPRSTNTTTAPSSSTYRGVSWERRSRKWKGFIYLNGKQRFLGYFQDEITAAKAYDSAARQYRKDVALNFPEDHDVYTGVDLSAAGIPRPSLSHTHTASTSSMGSSHSSTATTTPHPPSLSSIPTYPLTHDSDADWEGLQVQMQQSSRPPSTGINVVNGGVNGVATDASSVSACARIRGGVGMYGGVWGEVVEVVDGAEEDDDDDELVISDDDEEEDVAMVCDNDADSSGGGASVKDQGDTTHHHINNSGRENVGNRVAAASMDFDDAGGDVAGGDVTGGVGVGADSYMAVVLPPPPIAWPYTSTPLSGTNHHAHLDTLNPSMGSTHTTTTPFTTSSSSTSPPRPTKTAVDTELPPGKRLRLRAPDVFLPGEGPLSGDGSTTGMDYTHICANAGGTVGQNGGRCVPEGDAQASGVSVGGVALVEGVGGESRMEVDACELPLPPRPQEQQEQQPPVPQHDGHLLDHHDSAHGHPHVQQQQPPLHHDHLRMQHHQQHQHQHHHHQQQQQQQPPAHEHHVHHQQHQQGHDNGVCDDKLGASMPAPAYVDLSDTASASSLPTEALIPPPPMVICSPNEVATVPPPPTLGLCVETASASLPQQQQQEQQQQQRESASSPSMSSCSGAAEIVSQLASLPPPTDPPSQSHPPHPKKASNRYRGVLWHSRTGQWQAFIGLPDGRKKLLGYYAEEVQAAVAHDRAIKDLFKDGKHPPLNFVTQEEVATAATGPPVGADAEAAKCAPILSRFRGVSWDKGARKWKVQMRIEGKNRHMGSFKDEIEAARAYDRVAREYRKNPKLNFPEDPHDVTAAPALHDMRGLSAFARSIVASKDPDADPPQPPHTYTHNDVTRNTPAGDHGGGGGSGDGGDGTDTECSVATGRGRRGSSGPPVQPQETQQQPLLIPAPIQSSSSSSLNVPPQFWPPTVMHMMMYQQQQQHTQAVNGVPVILPRVDTATAILASVPPPSQSAHTANNPELLSRTCSTNTTVSARSDISSSSSQSMGIPVYCSPQTLPYASGSCVGGGRRGVDGGDGDGRGGVRGGGGKGKSRREKRGREAMDVPPPPSTPPRDVFSDLRNVMMAAYLEAPEADKPSYRMAAALLYKAQPDDADKQLTAFMQDTLLNPFAPMDLRRDYDRRILVQTFIRRFVHTGTHTHTHTHTHAHPDDGSGCAVHTHAHTDTRTPAETATRSHDDSGVTSCAASTDGANPTTTDTSTSSSSAAPPSAPSSLLSSCTSVPPTATADAHALPPSQLSVPVTEALMSGAGESDKGFVGGEAVA